MVAHLQKWTATLDTYSIPSGDSSSDYTRLRAPLQDMNGFTFSIRRKGITAKLDKALGAQDIDVGDPDFGHAFLVQSNNALMVQTLFSNPKLRQKLEAQKSITLGVINNELRIEVSGVVKDPIRLKSFFELFETALVQLEG